MAKLDDCHGKISALLAEIDKTNQSYRLGQQVLSALDGGEELNLTGVGMNLVIGDTSLPLPLPVDRDVIAERVAEGVGLMGEEVVRLWNEVFRVASEAKSHCDAARAQAQAAQQQEAPAPAPPGFGPPPAQLPPAAPLPPAAQPPQPPAAVPNLRPVQATGGPTVVRVPQPQNQVQSVIQPPLQTTPVQPGRGS